MHQKESIVTGWMWLAFFPVDCNGIGGGETYLYKHKDDTHPAFSKMLNPGEFLVFKDDQYFHHTSPVNAIAEVLGKILSQVLWKHK